MNMSIVHPSMYFQNHWWKYGRRSDQANKMKQMSILSCISNFTGNNMADAYSEQAPPCEAQIFYFQLWNEEVNYTS